MKNSSSKNKSKYLRWHRWLAMLLMLPLLVWLVTALGMTLIPRSATMAYDIKPAPVNVLESWPQQDALRIAAEGASAVTLQNDGMVTYLKLTPAGQDKDVILLSPENLEPAPDIAHIEIAQHAGRLTKEDIDAGAVTIKQDNSPEFQGLPTPALRVEADKAVLFFDPVTGIFLDQATFGHRLENWFKTIHVWDWNGNAKARYNFVLTFLSMLFLVAVAFSLLAFRRLHIRQKIGLRSMRWHQAIGLVASVQVVIWVATGLSVVWLLQPARDEAASMLEIQSDPIQWGQVAASPVDIKADLSFAPSKIVLTELLGEPVYQFSGSGRSPEQSLHSAVDGRKIILDEQARDRIAKTVLNPQSAAAIEKWELASSAKDIDEYFYTGPFPVWKGHFSEPVSGVLTIDKTTGHVHVTRTSRQVWLGEFYKLHVVYWKEGVIKYRQEPLLILVILAMFVLLVTGIFMQVKRYRATGSWWSR